MNRKLPRARVCLTAAALCVGVINVAQAGTILKLSLGNDPAPDVQFDGTQLSTLVDVFGGTPGDQNTAVEFLDFLGYIPPIPAVDASFTLMGVTVDGPATVVMPANVVVQSFTGGSFALYDDLNALLLSGTLGDSVLSGPVGGAATGALFTTTFGTASGPLSSLIAPGTVSLSMSMGDINGGAGFSVVAGDLASFTADATLNIGADPAAIPEPPTAVLVLLAGTLMLTIRQRRE